MSGDKLVNAATGELIAEMTPDEARILTDRLRTSLDITWDLIGQAFMGRAWAALGHPSWDAYCATEFPNARLRLPREERNEVIESLRAAGLSIRAIAATGVASKKTVERTIAASGVANDDTSEAVRAARERREREAAEASEPVDYGKCTAGFDCAAKATADDSMCDWHRKKANEASDAGSPHPPASDGEGKRPAADPPQPPGKAGAPESHAAATQDTGGTGPNVPHAPGADDGDGIGPSSADPVAVLPDDWRARLACSVHLLGCPVDALRDALTDDDRIDLTDLHTHLTAVLAEPQEQNE